MQILWGILYFFLLALVIIAAFFSSKFLASRPMGMTKGQYINIIDRVMLGRDKSILIIRVGEKIHLLAEGAQGFSNICELNNADLIKVYDKNSGASFKNIINSCLFKKEEVKESQIKEASSLRELKDRVTDSLSSMKSQKVGGKEQANEKE